MTVLEVQEISKSFGSFKAVDSVSFKVDTGRIYGLLGPNGAGKTTTIRMVMNILIPDSGDILLFNERMSDQLKSKIGYLPEERGLYPKMKVQDHLVFLAEIHGLSTSQAQAETLRWLQKLAIVDWRDKKIEELSKGMQQKLQFIGTVIHDPDLIILDEPFSGLDPVNVNLLKDIMLEFKERGKAIMLSTHMMDAAEKICDDILMINNGQKVLDGGLDDIQRRHGRNSVHLEYQGDGKFIRELDFVEKVDDYGNYIEVQLKDDRTANQLIQAMVDRVQISKLETHKSSLNEIFIEKVGGKNDE